MRLLTTGERRWGRGTKDSGDSTVPRDPTGRAYCTEVAVGLDRGLAGMSGGPGDRDGPRTPQPWRCRWSLQYSSHNVHGGALAAVGENRMGVQDGSHKYYLQIFLFERVSCSPRWPPTGYLGKDDLELLPSLLPRAGTQSSCCWVSSAHPPAAPPLIYFFFLFWSFHSVAQPSLELATVLLP